MSIGASINQKPLPKFRPLIPLLDETKRLDRGMGPLVNVSWLGRSIQGVLNSGENCDQIGRAMVPARQLVASMDHAEVDIYHAYAAQLSLYDCREPVIVVYNGRKMPDSFDQETCEILNGKARAIRAGRTNIKLPVIFVSRKRARFWGMPPWARQLGNTPRSSTIRLSTRQHRLRSGAETLPYGNKAGGAVISQRVAAGRSISATGRVTNPSAYGLVLSDGVRAYAHRMFTSRASISRGLVSALPQAMQHAPSKSGRSTPQHQETCLLILFAKLLEALRNDQRDNGGGWYDDFRLLRDWKHTAGLRMLMRQLLGLSLDKASLNSPDDKDKITEALRDHAKRARSALANAGPDWDTRLSERLLLLGATRNPKLVRSSNKADVLRRHYLELLDWTLRALFRAEHWRIGGKSIRRFDQYDLFHRPDEHDPTLETPNVERISHEVVGSPRFQALTDLEIEPLLILAMHARFNPFLIWHDMRWAVPHGHWAMAIADLDAGRPTHVTVWMAELYEEQRRRSFRHRH